MQNGAQDSLANHNICNQGKFPAEITSHGGFASIAIRSILLKN